MIVNVSSIAGKMTLPWFTLYSASKYALCSLGDGVRIELAAQGIHVMTVCPGYVDTGFQKHVLAGAPPESIARGRRFAITAQECAEAIALGIERDARTVVTPRTGWLLIAFARLFPRMVDAQLERMNARYGAGA
jgi:short-subunit dehydrogenase